MIKKISILLFLTLLLPPCLASDNFTLYLVRHAEKQPEGKNPKLTQCGQLRAKQLATLLSKADIQSVYSTSYQRTMSTAAPLSKARNVAIKHYDPRQLEQFSLHLKQRKENALIVGHSNTTPELTTLLSAQEVDSMNEKQYQNLYQIIFVDNNIELITLTQPLTCNIVL